MMSDYCCRIERASNGYTVELRDPKIVAANAKRDSTSKGSYTPYRDPNVSFVFQTVDQVLAFLKTHLDDALPLDEYGSSFTKAAAEISDDDNDGE